MNIDNYDLSSTGVNIEVALFFDTDQARRRFDEAFQRVKGVQTPTGYYGDVLFYKDFGENSYDDTGQCRNYDVDDDPKLLIRNIYNYIGGDIRELLRELEVNSKCAVEEILSEFENYVRHEDEYLEFLSKYYDLLFDLYMSRGYCQGDVCTVLIPPHYAHLSDVQISQMKESIDHFLWDCPIYLRIEVDGEDLDIQLDDEYHYREEEIVEKAKVALKDSPKELDVVVSFLERNLPAILDDYV